MSRREPKVHYLFGPNLDERIWCGLKRVITTRVTLVEDDVTCGNCVRLINIGKSEGAYVASYQYWKYIFQGV